MESLANIAAGNLRTSAGTEKITSTSSVEERRKALYFILTEYREAHQYPALSTAELELRINSWLPVTAPVPANRLHDCYVWAMQNRSPQYPLSAGELVEAWRHLQQRSETEGSSQLRDDRLLPENAATACVRCYKQRGPKGEITACLEIHPDGSIGGACDHRPLTEEEKQAAADVRRDILAQGQREARARLKARHEAELKAKEEAAKPEEHHLECSACDRRVSTFAGWETGDVCSVRLERESAVCPKCKCAKGVQSLGRMTCRSCFHSYDVVTCKGQMAKA